MKRVRSHNRNVNGKVVSVREHYRKLNREEKVLMANLVIGKIVERSKHPRLSEVALEDIVTDNLAEDSEYYTKER